VGESRAAPLRALLNAGHLGRRKVDLG
jgi:hypothetical protein